MLRQVIESHGALRDEWRRSREKLMCAPGEGEHSVITLGDAHVLLELQIANQVMQLDPLVSSSFPSQVLPSQILTRSLKPTHTFFYVLDYASPARTPQKTSR